MRLKSAPSRKVPLYKADAAVQVNKVTVLKRIPGTWEFIELPYDYAEGINGFTSFPSYTRPGTGVYSPAQHVTRSAKLGGSRRSTPSNISFSSIPSQRQLRGGTFDGQLSIGVVGSQAKVHKFPERVLSPKGPVRSEAITGPQLSMEDLQITEQTKPLISQEEKVAVPSGNENVLNNTDVTISYGKFRDATALTAAAIQNISKFEQTPVANEMPQGAMEQSESQFLESHSDIVFPQSEKEIISKMQGSIDALNVDTDGQMEEKTRSRSPHVLHQRPKSSIAYSRSASRRNSAIVGKQGIINESDGGINDTLKALDLAVTAEKIDIREQKFVADFSNRFNEKVPISSRKQTKRPSTAVILTPSAEKEIANQAGKMETSSESNKAAKMRPKTAPIRLSSKKELIQGICL